MCLVLCQLSNAGRCSRLTSARVWSRTRSTQSVLAAMLGVVVVEVTVDVPLRVLEAAVPPQRVGYRAADGRRRQRLERLRVGGDHAVPPRVVVRKRAALADGAQGSDADDALRGSERVSVLR